MNMPPLNALRAFEAAARNASFARAAEELHVTPAALSHQIKGLEEFLGLKLFLRKPRAIELTDAGRTLYPGVHAGFGQLRQAVQGLDRVRNENVLVISSPPGFTAKWLAPRLHRFLMANPDIDARISSTRTFVDFESDGVDVAIRNVGDSGPGAGHFTEKLVDIWTLVVVAPSLIEEVGGIETPADLLKTTLISDESVSTLPGVPYWKDWFAANGLDDVDLSRGLRFNSADHALEAALEGAGALLCYRTLAYDDLRIGRLVTPFQLQMPVNRSFYLVCSEGAEERPTVAAFREWVRDEFQKMTKDCERVAQPNYCPVTDRKAKALSAEASSSAATRSDAKAAKPTRPGRKRTSAKAQAQDG